MAIVGAADLNFGRNDFNVDHDDGFAELAPVGSYPQGASWVGAEDMSGNVYEWTGTLFADFPYDAEDGRETPGAEDYSSRALRGGGFNMPIVTLRAAFRRPGNPSSNQEELGFSLRALDEIVFSGEKSQGPHAV